MSLSEFLSAKLYNSNDKDVVSGQLSQRLAHADSRRGNVVTYGRSLERKGGPRSHAFRPHSASYNVLCGTVVRRGRDDDASITSSRKLVVQVKA